MWWWLKPIRPHRGATHCSLSSDSEDEYYSCQSLPSVSRESDNLASEDGPNSQVNEIIIDNSDANDNYKMGLL